MLAIVLSRFLEYYLKADLLNFAKLGHENIFMDGGDYSWGAIWVSPRS